MAAAPPTDGAKGVGSVVASFARGALILEDERGAVWRASWESDEEPQDRRRALPAGEYTLRGYRIQRRAEDGAEWHVSATGDDLRELVVAEGETVECRIDPRVRASARLQGGGKQVGMQIQGEGRAGLSIYKDGARIPIGYRLVAKDGSVVARGRMRYG